MQGIFKLTLSPLVPFPWLTFPKQSLNTYGVKNPLIEAMSPYFVRFLAIKKNFMYHTFRISLANVLRKLRENANSDTMTLQSRCTGAFVKIKS